MLLTSYEPEVILPPCDFTRETVSAIGHIAGDISPVFPYLNAIMPGAEYQPAGPVLRFKWEGHMVTLRPDEMAAAGFRDADEAVGFLARLQEVINDTWERRHEIQPSYVQRKRLVATDVYRLLPRTNCKACGQPTCFTFAAKLTLGEVGLEACPVLFEPGYAEQRARLEEMVANAVFV
ncbi:MAG: (Fe-S)-binding protein [Anaerolineae bacterium]